MLSSNKKIVKILISCICLFNINLNALTLKESVLDVVDNGIFKENKTTYNNEDIAFTITNLYIDVIRNRELLENAKQSLSNNEGLYKEILKLYIHGKVSKNEMTRVYEAFSQAKINLTTQQNNMINKELEFKKIHGKEINVMTFSLPSLDINKIQESYKNNVNNLINETELDKENILNILQVQTVIFNSKNQMINAQMDKFYNKYKTLNEAGILIKSVLNED